MKKIYIIDAVSSYKISYAVTAESKEEAREKFEKGNLEEMGQQWLGERFIKSFEVTEDGYIAYFDEINDYLKEWTKEQKMQFIDKEFSE